MMLLKRLLLMLLCALLFGCCIVQPKQTVPAGRIGLLLSPATFGQSVVLQQHLVVTRAGQRYDLDTVLQINQQQLSMIGLMLSHRILTLHYDGHTLQVWRDPHMPQQINGEEILEDIQLTLWPVTILRQSLPPGWEIKESHLQRVVLFNNKIIEKIQYSNKPYWNSTITLNNNYYHYQLIIQSTET